MPIPGRSGIYSILKSKTVLGLGGVAIVGGSIAIPITLSIGNKSEQPEDKKIQHREELFFTKEQLKQVVSEYDKVKKADNISELIPEESQSSLPKDTEIDQFLSAVRITRNYASNPGDNGLTVEHKKVLKIFFDLYAEIESKDISSSKSNSFESSIASADLERLDGDKSFMRVHQGAFSEENNGGGGEGSQINPFRHFYRNDENGGKAKMRKLRSTSTSFDPIVVREIEYDIASWMIKDIERMHLKYLEVSESEGAEE